MSEYLAKIRGTAYERIAGIERRVNVEEDYIFPARNEERAKQVADKYLSDLSRKLVRPNIRILSVSHT